MDDVVTSPEGLAGLVEAMILRPAPDDGVESANHDFGLVAATFLDDGFHLFLERKPAGLRRSGEQFHLEFTEILTQKVEAILDPHDLGFLRGEQQATLLEKSRDGWNDLEFKMFFAGSGDDEVIGIPNKVDLVPSPVGHRLDDLFQAVQGHVGQAR